MTTTTALALLLAAAPLAGLPSLAAAAPASGAPEAESYGMQAPPAGASADDAALWKRGREVDVRIPIERGVSTRLMARANGSRWEQRLAEGVKRGQLTAARAADLRKGLLAQWDVLTIILGSTWKVDPTRVCSYQLLDFDSALRVDEPGRRAQLLPPSRVRLAECVEIAAKILGELERANGAFEGALAAIEKEAPELPPVVAPAAVTAPPPPAAR